MLHENYKILDHIKDGKATIGKFNSLLPKFNKPNIVIVFSNNEPDMSHLSTDRWIIFKISNDLEHLEERCNERMGGYREEYSIKRHKSDDSNGGYDYPEPKTFFHMK